MADRIAERMREAAENNRHYETLRELCLEGANEIARIRVAAIYECVALAEKLDDCGGPYIVERLRDLAMLPPPLDAA